MTHLVHQAALPDAVRRANKTKGADCAPEAQQARAPGLHPSSRVWYFEAS